MKRLHGCVLGRVGAVLAALLMLAAGCGNRPSLDAWEQEWRPLVDAIPAEGLPSDPPDRAECDRYLGTLREVLPDLRPAPNDVLESAVTAWVEFGESVFFECPISGGEHAGWEAASLELQRLRAEVEAQIAFEHRA